MRAKARLGGKAAYMVIGEKISKFNHACKPNAYLNWVDNVRNVKYYGVWTVAKVKRGDELTLDYANGHAEAHDAMKAQHGFACSCTMQAMHSARVRAKIELALATKFTQTQRGLIDPLVDAYLMRWGNAVSRAQSVVRKFAKDNIRTAEG